MLIVTREGACCDEPLSTAHTFKATSQLCKINTEPDNLQHLIASGSVISCGQPDSRAEAARHV